MSFEPINKRFPDATNEVLEPLKSHSNDKDLETSDGGEDEQFIKLNYNYEQTIQNINYENNYIMYMYL